MAASDSAYLSQKNRAYILIATLRSLRDCYNFFQVQWSFQKHLASLMNSLIRRKAISWFDNDFTIAIKSTYHSTWQSFFYGKCTLILSRKLGLHGSVEKGTRTFFEGEVKLSLVLKQRRLSTCSSLPTRSLCQRRLTSFHFNCDFKIYK